MVFQSYLIEITCIGGANRGKGDMDHRLQKAQIFRTACYPVNNLEHLGVKIKDMKTVEEMWAAVKSNVTTKSTLYLLNAEEQLASMKLRTDNEDPKTHLSKLKDHFQLMIQQHKSLIKMGSVLLDSCY